MRVHSPPKLRHRWMGSLLLRFLKNWLGLSRAIPPLRFHAASEQTTGYVQLRQRGLISEEVEVEGLLGAGEAGEKLSVLEFIKRKCPSLGGYRSVWWLNR